METAKSSDSLFNPDGSFLTMSSIHPSSTAFGGSVDSLGFGDNGSTHIGSGSTIRRPTALAYNNQDLFNLASSETNNDNDNNNQGHDFYGEPIDLQASLDELHHDKRKTFFESDPYLSSTVSKAAKSEHLASPSSGSSESSGRTPSITETPLSGFSPTATNTDGTTPKSAVKPAPKKPGRKPKTTEPESKRKAQNRAAQRAFRERKEKHLKELEDKISQLESEAESANSQNEFLRKQVSQLETELSRYRTRGSAVGEAPTGDKKQSRTGSTTSSSFEVSPSSGINKDGKPFTFEFPFFNNASSRPSSIHRPSNDSSSSYLSPMSTTSSAPTRYSPQELLGNDSARVEAVEGPNKFCAEMSLACGSNSNPVPQVRGNSESGCQGTRSPIIIGESTRRNDAHNSHESLRTSEQYNKDSPTAFSTGSGLSPNFDLDFLNDLHDPIFDGESFTLPELPVSYNMFDPMENPLANSSFDSMSKAKPVSELRKDHQPVAIKHENEDEVIPANTGRFVKCAEAWDRICSHPKFNDIDIEGLCFELRAKAKCSDSGVLLKEQDLNNALKLLD